MEGDGRLAHAVPTRLSGPYTAAAGRKFGLTVGIAFVVLAGIGRWRGHPTTFMVLGSLGLARAEIEGLAREGIVHLGGDGS